LDWDRQSQPTATRADRDVSSVDEESEEELSPVSQPNDPSWMRPPQRENLNLAQLSAQRPMTPRPDQGRERERVRRRTGSGATGYEPI
jgi:hypothetical protein